MYRNVHTNTHVGATRIGTTALSLYNSDYAVRWAGFVRATTAGTYEFKTELLGANNSDIGYNANTPSYERVRLWIGNRMVQYQPAYPPTRLVVLSLVRLVVDCTASAATRYPIKVYYKQSVLNASSGLRLQWRRESSTRQVHYAPTLRDIKYGIKWNQLCDHMDDGLDIYLT
eukprot:2158206-Rhodomonas_salina.3